MKLRSLWFRLTLRWHWYVLTPFFRYVPLMWRWCGHPTMMSGDSTNFVTVCARCYRVMPAHMQMCGRAAP